MDSIAYVKVSDGYLAKKAGDPPGRRSNVSLLLGARIHYDHSALTDGWAPARTVPDARGKSNTGFIHIDQISNRQQLKVFYTDVGQGDAILIEAEGAIVIIDGGPNRGFPQVLKDRLEDMRRADVDAGLAPRSHLFINAIIVSHFDKDHYYGLKRLFESPEVKVGTFYHNGLPRYGDSAGKDLALGDVVNHRDGTRSLSVDLTGIDSAKALVESDLMKTAGGADNLFSRFLQAVIKAHDAGRLDKMKRLYRRNPSGAAALLPDVGEDLQFEVLAPLTTKLSGPVRLPAFPDPHDVTATNPNPSPSASHTINGNSVVLRLRYKDKLFLFGGDLNQPAQIYLNEKYGDEHPFKADVNKACHHGSSDFDVDFLKRVEPDATIFSSGDDGSYDHPLPDAMGAAGKHGAGEFPLVFSTELARDNKTSVGIVLGHINARSNGTEIVMAQKKEKASTKNPWHTFRLPYPGPFGHE